MSGLQWVDVRVAVQCFKAPLFTNMIIKAPLLSVGPMLIGQLLTTGGRNIRDERPSILALCVCVWYTLNKPALPYKVYTDHASLHTGMLLCHLRVHTHNINMSGPVPNG